MSYLANSARLASLTINGVDYTSSLVSWTASDSTAYKNGCIVTTGELVLGRRTGTTSIEDYDRNSFKRGMPVILEVTYPDGTTQRHPRGLLYVLTNTYDVQADEITVSLGCRLALMNLTDEIDDILAIVPVFLDTAQKTFSNVSAAFASVGQYVYQDNTGALQTGEFFDGDSTAGFAAGQFVSIAGVTALSVQPLAGTEPLPDRLLLQYQVPKGVIASDNRGYVDTVTDISKYWTQFPAISYVRVMSADAILNLDDYLASLQAARNYSSQQASRTSSSCGNEPPPPSGPGYTPVTPIYASCDDQFQQTKQQQYLSVTRTQVQDTYYDAPGGQVSRVYAESYGPALEANNQYFADKYAYCRALYASQCNPNGSCSLPGQNNIRLGYVETLNYYGDANELIRTVQDTWVTTLSAAQPTDWRANIVNGVPQNFNGNLSETALYRASRVVTQYFKEGNANVQVTTNYTSIASRQVGISVGTSRLDALNGIITSNKRISTTTATLEVAPDRVNSATTDTEEKSSEIVLFTGRYTSSPDEAGPYYLEEQIPVPLLFNTSAEINAAVGKYENYITRFIKGDAFGQQISEALRKDIADAWVPGVPFRYYDVGNDELLGMRADATVWGVDQDGAAVVMNGIWTGKSNGTLTLPENLVGNSAPDLGGGGPTPPPAVVPPSVDTETDVNDGAYAFVIDVEWEQASTMESYGADGILDALPADLDYRHNLAFLCTCAGLVVEPGSLLNGDGNGGIPIEYQGSLLVVSATVVDEDLFATV